MLETGSPGAAAEVAVAGGGRAVEVAHRVHHPLGRLGVGGAGGEAGVGPGRADHRHLALDAVDDQHHRRAEHQRVGQAERVGVDVRQPLDQPHHVVAEVAEEAGGHRRQLGRQVDPALGDQRARGSPAGRRRPRAPGVGVEARRTVEPRGGAAALPDQVGLHPHDRVAAAHLAAGDALEQEAVLARLGQLQHQRHRRVEVGDQAGPDHLVAARRRSPRRSPRSPGRAASREAGERRFDQRLVHRDPGPVAHRGGVERQNVVGGLAVELLASAARATAAFSAAAGSNGSTALTLRRITPSPSARTTAAPRLGGEDVGDELRRRAVGGVAAGQRRRRCDRPAEALGERGEAEAALELGDVALGELGQRLGGRAAVQSAATRSRTSARGRTAGGSIASTRSVARPPSASSTRSVSTPTSAASAAARKAGSSARPPVVSRVERHRARLEHRLGGDLLGGGAAGEQVLDMGGVLVDAAARPRRGRGSAAAPRCASSNGVVVAARMALIAVERRPERGRRPGRRCPGPRRRRPRRGPGPESRSAVTKPWSMSSGFSPRSAASASKSISPASSRAFAAAASSVGAEADAVGDPALGGPVRSRRRRRRRRAARPRGSRSSRPARRG